MTDTALPRSVAAGDFLCPSIDNRAGIDLYFCFMQIADDPLTM